MAEVQASEVRPKTSRASKRRLRILLAEDNPVNQKLTVQVLMGRGHRVELAENGRIACELHEREAFDLILMDLQMPELGGLEACRRIREREEKTGGHVPIVALTAKAMKGDRDKCLEAGMDAYISKPVHTVTLVKTIAKILKAQEQGRSAEEVRTEEVEEML